MKKTAAITATLAIVMAFSTAYAGGRLWTTKGGYPAAMYKADLENVITYSVQKDKEALIKLLDQGRFVILKPGTKVFVVTTSGLGKVKVRPQGTTLEFWTLTEAIE